MPKPTHHRILRAILRPSHACTLALLIFSTALPAVHAQLPAGTTDTTQPQPQQPDPLLTQANQALDKQDYAAALKLLTTLAQKHPTDPHILYDLASTQDALDQTSAAEATYRQAIAADPNFFEPHLALGLLLARNHQLQAARTELTTATTLDTPDPALKARAYRALARLDLQTKDLQSQLPDPSAASDALLAAIKLTTETSDDILLSAEIAEAANDLPAAEAAYRRLLAAHPGDPDATAGLTHLLRREQKPGDTNANTEKLLTDALARNPDDPTLNAQLASLYADQGRLAEALPIAEKLRAADPQNAAVTRLLARLYSRNGQYDQSEPLFAALLSSASPASPPDPTLLDDRADALIHLHRAAEAEALLKRAVAQPDTFPSKDDLALAASHLAFAASQNNDPAITLQALAIRDKVLPQSPSSLFLSATAHDKLHQVKLAVDLYKQFLSVANGKFPDEEWEARHRLTALEHTK